MKIGWCFLQAANSQADGAVHQVGVQTVTPESGQRKGSIDFLSVPDKRMNLLVAQKRFCQGNKRFLAECLVPPGLQAPVDAQDGALAGLEVDVGSVLFFGAV